jgi:hypothetical protein
MIFLPLLVFLEKQPAASVGVEALASLLSARGLRDKRPDKISDCKCETPGVKIIFIYF